MRVVQYCGSDERPSGSSWLAEKPDPIFFSKMKPEIQPWLIFANLFSMVLEKCGLCIILYGILIWIVPLPVPTAGYQAEIIKERFRFRPK